MTVLLDKIPKAIKTISGIATALIGCATLAFIFGFFARKAQLEAAGVPFVFVDYWTYVEFGVLGAIDCITIVFSETWSVGILAALAAIMFLLFEWSWFKRATRSPALFVLYMGGTLIFIGLTLSQLLEVRALARDGDLIHKAQQGTETVPAQFPFAAFVPKPLEPPTVSEDTVWPTDAPEGWSALMAVAVASAGQQNLELRPRPYWAVEPPDDGTNLLFLARPLDDPKRLDAQRARRLFALIFGALWWIFALIVVGVLWHRDLRAQAAGPDREIEDGVSRWRAAFMRTEDQFKQEIWLLSRWVLLPVTLLCGLTSLLLMPTAYGSLARNTLSQEMVEVVLASPDPAGGKTSAKAARDDGPELRSVHERRDILRGAFKDSKSLDEALELIDSFADSEGNKRRLGEIHLRRVAEAIAQESQSESGLRRLGGLYRAARMRALGIAEPIRRAWRQLEHRLRSSKRGFILAYPRSAKDTLKLIEWDPIAREAKWMIHPVPQASIDEVRVRQDAELRRFVDRLNELQRADYSHRWGLLRELEAVGHPLALEAYLMALFDDYGLVRGMSITHVGKLAASLPRTKEGDRRRRFAFAALARIAYNPDLRDDHRGAAFTSLMKVAQGTDLATSLACPALLEAVQGKHGTGYEVVSAAMTAAAEIKCPDIGLTLVNLLDSGDWSPEPELLEGVPTALRYNLNEPKVVATLLRLSGDPSVHEIVRASALSQLGGVAFQSVLAQEAADGIERLLTRSSDQSATRAVGYAREAAIDSLGEIGDPRKAGVLVMIAESAQEDDNRRFDALAALEKLGTRDADFQRRILGIADSTAATEIRTAAITVLSSTGHPTWLVDGLAALCNPCNPTICQTVGTTLDRMRRSGSGHANRKLIELKRAHCVR